MSDLPDPFEHLPPEWRRLLDSMVSGGGLPFGGGAVPTGPVDWGLARRTALHVAQPDDREPTTGEADRFEQASRLAEHWLDETWLPAPPDAGRLVVASRTRWVDAALAAMRPWVEPVAGAATAAMTGLAQQQLGQLGSLELDDADLRAMGLDQLGLDADALRGMLSSFDPAMLGQAMGPMGATLAGVQAGQVIGQLARQVLGQYELGIPTAPRSQAFALAVNVAEAFDGWDLDDTEVAVVLTLGEGAHRRLFQAVPWLEGHLHELVDRFAAGTELDLDRLEQLARELMGDLDPEDPDSLQEAIGRASSMRMEPTPAQRRVLARIQAAVGLVGAWARREVARAARDRLPGRERVEEVLRRRRGSRGTGDELLAGLLGLDLRPDDGAVADAFVAVVEDARGPDGLQQALAHPENLPDLDELADPSVWLERMAGGASVPDDASALFGSLGEAPREASADERATEGDATDDGATDADGGADGGGADDGGTDDGGTDEDGGVDGRD